MALPVFLVGALTLDILGRFAESMWLRSAVDSPLAFAFWTYLVLTPVLSAAALWLDPASVRLTRTVKALSIAWLLLLAAVTLIPFLR